MEVLPPVSYPLSNMNWYLGQGRALRWSPAENKMFENALAIHDKDTPDRWHKVAAKIPGKTVEDVILHYRELESDVTKIEAGLIPAPGYSTLPPPFTLEVSTSYMFDGFKPSYNFRIGGKRSASTRPFEHERKKGVPWTEEEHKLFLMGLKKYGKGDWRNISRNFVTTKTPTQVASHAQKYFIRQLSGGKDKRRASIHDITTANLDENRSPSPDNRQHPSPDRSSYAMLLHQPIPARASSFLWNQSGNGGTVTVAASRGNVLLPPLPLGAGSNKTNAEPQPRYVDGTFKGSHNKVFQIQSGDSYYRSG